MFIKINECFLFFVVIKHENLYNCCEKINELSYLIYS